MPIEEAKSLEMKKNTPNSMETHNEVWNLLQNYFGNIPIQQVNLHDSTAERATTLFVNWLPNLQQFLHQPFVHCVFFTKNTLGVLWTSNDCSTKPNSVRVKYTINLHGTIEKAVAQSHHQPCQ